MRDFNRGSKFSDRRNFNGGRSDRTMHQAICSNCGKECQVPFKPTNGKPVFCSMCFEIKRPPDSRRGERRSPGRSGFGSKPMYEAICDQCGSKCSLPFQPTSEKPVYCSQCFENKNDKKGMEMGQLQAQLEGLNNKLDKILQRLEPAIPISKPQDKTVNKIKASPVKKTTPAVKKEKNRLLRKKS